MNLFALVIFQGGVSGLAQYAPFLLILLVMYFILIRPQQKRQREVQAMLSELKPGDHVVTSGGIIGEVLQIKEKTASLVIKSEKSILEIARSAVASRDTEAGT